MADTASSPAGVGRDSSAATSAAAAATVTPADDIAESAMPFKNLELQDKIQELVIVMRKEKIDYTYVAERRSIICKLPVTYQVQALQKLIACMRQDSEEYATLDGLGCIPGCVAVIWGFLLTRLEYWSKSCTSSKNISSLNRV